MLTINLIPKKLKDELKLQRLSKSIDKILITLVLFFVVIVSLLYTTIFYMQSHLELFQIIASDASKNTESYVVELTTINKNTEFIQTIQADHSRWSLFFAAIEKLINPGMTVNTITLDKETKAITIAAHANTRDDLLKFKSNLEETKLLNDIVFPIKTLFEKEDINFSINAQINSQNLNEL